MWGTLLGRLLDCLCCGRNSAFSPKALVQQQRWEQTFLPCLSLCTASLAGLVHTAPPAPPSVNTLCDTIDTDYGFYLLKNMLRGSVEMSGKAPRLQDLLGIYRSPKAALWGERVGAGAGGGGGGSNVKTLVGMQPLFSISPWAGADVGCICIYMYLHRSNQKLKVPTQFWDSKQNTNQCFNCN